MGGVDQGDAVRVFVLGGMEQRPGRGVGEVGRAVIGTGRHSLAGQDGQLGVEGVGSGQPVLELGQGVLGERV
ncbi:hypothetical protein MSIMFI_05580 [Mycobacterium simulans]|nr:hypothetical protein MSIMFI_05580 [Mycobacterium simulans]